MKTQEVSVKDIIINPAIATRKSDPDPDRVKEIAQSYLFRHNNGMEPIQMMPGYLQPAAKDGKFELIDGRYRLEGILAVNEAGGLDGEPMMFTAYVVRSKGDFDALVSGIQANFHSATDNFDKADAMQKLLDASEANGSPMEQKEVAAIFGVHPATVTQLLKLNSVPKKYVKAFRDGDLEQEAVLAIADLEAGDSQIQEIFEESLRHRERFQILLARKEHKDAKADVAARLEEAKARNEELAKKAKEAEKLAKDADKALSKAADEKETKRLREEKRKADEAKKTIGKEWAAAEKEVVKLKDEKEKVAAAVPTPKKAKVTKEDVQETARAKGAKGKGGKEIAKTPKSKKQFEIMLEAMGEDKKNPLPEAAIKLIGKIEGVLDGDYSAEQLEKAFRTYCVPD